MGKRYACCFVCVRHVAWEMQYSGSTSSCVLLQDNVERSRRQTWRVLYSDILTAPLLSNSENLLPSVWLVVPEWQIASQVVQLHKIMIFIAMLNIKCSKSITTYLVWATLWCVDVLVYRFLGFSVTSPSPAMDPEGGRPPHRGHEKGTGWLSQRSALA